MFRWPGAGYAGALRGPRYSTNSSSIQGGKVQDWSEATSKFLGSTIRGPSAKPVYYSEEHVCGYLPQRGNADSRCGRITVTHQFLCGGD